MPGSVWLPTDETQSSTHLQPRSSLRLVDASSLSQYAIPARCHETGVPCVGIMSYAWQCHVAGPELSRM